MVGGAGRRKKPGGERNVITACPMPLPDLCSGVESRESCAFSFADHTAGLTRLRMTTSNQTRVAFVFPFFHFYPFCVPWECLRTILFFRGGSLFSPSLGFDEHQVRGRNPRRGCWLLSESTSARQLCTCLHLTQAPPNRPTTTTTGARPLQLPPRAIHNTSAAPTETPALCQKLQEFFSANQQPS